VRNKEHLPTLPIFVAKQLSPDLAALARDSGGQNKLQLSTKLQKLDSRRHKALLLCPLLKLTCCLAPIGVSTGWVKRIKGSSKLFMAD
jgi:hypothetical protein